MLHRFGPVFLVFIFLSCEISHRQVPVVKFSLPGEVMSHSFENGDVIFQTSTSSESRAIQQATHSIYSHCGIILWQDGQCYVYESNQLVKKTPIKEWILRGKDHHYVVKRMIDSANLGRICIRKMLAASKAYDGKKYDMYFGWSDDRIYSAELVWKIYHYGAGIDLAQPMKLKEFDLSSPIVKEKLEERYGKNIPYEELVISTSQLYESPYLETVFAE